MKGLKWVCWICLCGLIANLVLMVLPAWLRPYHVRHWMDDYKVELVEQTSEYGFASRGIVRGRFSIQYSQGDRKSIGQIRRDWYQNIQNAKTPCPADGHLIQYNEWGPSHTVRPDGIDVVEVGLIYSVPYSFGAIACAVPLVGIIFFSTAKRLRNDPLHKQLGTGIL